MDSGGSACDVAKARKEMISGGFHSYFRMRRIWAQKPFDTKPAAEKAEFVVENV